MTTSMHPTTIIAAALLLAALLHATVVDLRTRRIPNLLSLGILLGGLAAQGLVGGWPALVGSVSGILVGLVLLMPAYMMKGMGAGDVKLMAACGAWMSASIAATAVALTLLVGLGMALVLTATRVLAPATPAASPGDLRSLARPRIKFPYAAAIATGSLGALLLAYGSPDSSPLPWLNSGAFAS